MQPWGSTDILEYDDKVAGDDIWPNSRPVGPVTHPVAWTPLRPLGVPLHQMDGRPSCGPLGRPVQTQRPEFLRPPRLYFHERRNESINN